MDPGIRISALGGPGMQLAGAEIVMDPKDFAVMGFTEVVRKFPKILEARKQIQKFIASEKVDAFVPIDFPGFNGSIASSAKKNNIPVFWLVAPQVWAWGGWRTNGFRRKIDRLGTILPFEQSFFEERGFDVFPMGHPLMEDYWTTGTFENMIKAREKNFENRQNGLTIGIVPGSRHQELDHLLPILKVTSQAIVGYLEAQDVKFIVSCAPGVKESRIRMSFDTSAEVTTEPLPRLFQRVDLALVCSGTASLEAALAGVPHELVYRTGSLNAWLGRNFLKVPYIGLTNLILDRPVIRENIQQDATPLPLAMNLLRWIARPSERQEFYSSSRVLRDQCGKPGVWRRTARAVIELADGKS